MRLRPVSDLHLAHHRDGGNSFLSGFDPLTSDEVLVLAGDIVDSAGHKDRLSNVLSRLCGKWKTVIYVLGNHEYYNTSFSSVHRLMRDAEERFPNLVWLNNTHREIDGLTFFGGTGWFPFDPSGTLFESWMNDFETIFEARRSIYGSHTEFRDKLKFGPKPDVVVAHHLPSRRSIDPIYQMHPASELNRFFLGDVEDLIFERQPRLYIHGHTHSGFDYDLGDTRVICHPFGYPGEAKRQFREDLVVEV